MKNIIYTIMVMKKLEEIEKIHCPDFGDCRLVGFYFDKEMAFDSVQENCCDIWETFYDYAVIEEIEAGLYQSAAKDKRWFFHYNKNIDKYELIEEPIFLQNISGLTMG